MSIALYGLGTPTFKSQVYIDWLRHKAQNALVGADRRTVRSRAACFFCRPGQRLSVEIVEPPLVVRNTAKHVLRWC